MLLILRKIDICIEKLTRFSIFTNILGIARTVLVLSTLLTLVFNNPDTLFKPDGTGNFAINNLLYLNKANLFLMFPYRYINVARGTAIVCLSIVASGWRPRITCFIHFWVCISFINSAMLIEGGDQIASNLSLLLIPICLMDSRKWHWNLDNTTGKFKLEKRLIANFFYLIIRVQIAVIYFHSAIGKMFVEEWRNGTAIYYWFNDPIFGMVNNMKPFVNPILFNPYGIVFITWGSIFLEIILFTGLIVRKTYWKYLLCAGILFHLGIVFIHGLFSFFLSMFGALLLYLGPVYHQNLYIMKLTVKSRSGLSVYLKNIKNKVI